jgi:mono/diheme cytochrome c family protein
MRYLTGQARALAKRAHSKGRVVRTSGALLIALGCTLGANTAIAVDGKALFEAKCAACHSIGGGPKVGPDLKGVIAKRGKDGTVLAILDPAAARLQPTMPNLGLSKAEAEATVAYLDSGTGAVAAAGETSTPVVAPQPADIQRGQELFDGTQRFAKGGPSCNACHDVKSDAIASGGILASELTLVFSRMGSKGLQSILANSPFPVMQAAYAGRELSGQEIAALAAFFQQVEKGRAGQLPRETTWKMFAAGIGGVLVLLALFSLIGGRRKTQCVNQDIYDRQAKSEK